MATAKRNLINGVSSSTELTPYVYNGSSWVIAHTEVYTGSSWVEIPNWTAASVRPTSAMTSNTAPSPYIATGSSRYSTSYDYWKAFNKSYSDAYGWASANNPGSAPYIQLYTGIALKNIYVTIRNRTRSSLVNGIYTGYIQGSDNGSTWTTIGTITGAPGSTSAGVSTHYCSNYDDTYTYVRIVATDWNNRTASDSNYISIGEIYIYGKYAN